MFVSKDLFGRRNLEERELMMFNNSRFWVYSQIDELVSKFFTVTSVSYKEMSPSRAYMETVPIPAYEILRRSDLASSMPAIDNELRELGFIPLLRPHPTHESRGMLYILPISNKMKESEKQKISTPIILYIFTILSVMFVGLNSWEILRQVDPSLDPILTSLLYVIGLVGIVSIHELGHMIASRLHGIKASWPYFIPFPFGYGTMGAFIQQKSPIRTKNALFDIGLSGPIFGLIVSIAFTILGLMISFTAPAALIPSEMESSLFVLDFRLESPTRYRILLFEFLAYIIVPATTESFVVLLHPLAFTGYIGLLLTGLNLIPIGQLDGGHVARSLFSERNHRTMTYISAGIMFVLGFWPFALLILIMYSQTGHAGPLDDISSVTTSRKLVAVFMVLVALVCLPIPIELFNLIFPF